MLAVRLDSIVESRLTKLAQETGRSKSYYVRQAIENFLDDHENHLLALAVLEKDEPRKTLTEVKKELGLES